jgi:hypothetical protein
VYFLICDDDQYWKNGQVFCEENGYDGLATLHSDAEFQFLSDMLNTNQGIIDPNGSNRDARGWLGFTRGPDCAPVTNTGTGFASVCGTSVSSYYWLDNGDTSWVSGSYWFPNEGSNNVEHCTQLKLNTATGEVGMWDLYCDVVNTAPHDQWSLSHTRPSICVKRN